MHLGYQKVTFVLYSLAHSKRRQERALQETEGVLQPTNNKKELRPSVQ
jgi:hypothetical protein